MNSQVARSALLALGLIGAACGSGGDETANDTSAGETTTTAAEAPASTAEETTTTAPPTTESTTTTVAETTTTTEATPAFPDPPPAGTGILTIGEVEYPFTIDKCVTEPAPGPLEGSLVLFEVRGSTTAEGQAAEARILRISTANSNPNDSFGWGYALDPNDFESVRSEGSAFGIGEHVIMQETEAGLTFYGPPTPFERTEGISVVDDAEPGLGSIIATC